MLNHHFGHIFMIHTHCCPQPQDKKKKVMSLSDHITKNLICIQVTRCLESKYISINKHSLASSAHHRSPYNYAGYLLFHEWGKEMVHTASCLNNTSHEHSTASKVAVDKKKAYYIHTHTSEFFQDYD